jgi:hypothetical protein
MKGYKVFNEEFWWIEDCQCEVRETYESDGDGGFKFYQYFDSIFNDYRMSPKLRIYEVVAFGDIRHEYMRERTTKIKILRELQLEDYIAIDTNYSKLYAFLKYKNTPYSWKDFVKSSYAPIRAFAAEFGNSYVRWKLINDKSCMVRAAVARFGSNIQRWLLINDQHYVVRKNVARYGTHRQRRRLINDESEEVRREIIDSDDGRLFDDMINDSCHYVREEIARRGNRQHRDILSHDDDPRVLKVVFRRGTIEQQDYITRNCSDKNVVKEIMEYGNDYHIDMAKRNAPWLFREDC